MLQVGKARIVLITMAGLFAVVALAACGPGAAPLESPLLPTATAEPPTATLAPPAPTAEGEESGLTAPPPATVPGSVPVAPEAEAVVAAARADLAGRLDVPEAKIGVRSVEAVDWPDASLGCPEPGMMYAQVITPGFRVVLEAAGQAYEYHTDTGQTAVFCTPLAAESLPHADSAEPAEIARQNLAERLGIEVEGVRIVATVRQEFPADAFYCRTVKGRDAKEESPAVIPGETILLSAAGRRYEYHASGQTVLFCRALQ